MRRVSLHSFVGTGNRIGRWGLSLSVFTAALLVVFTFLIPAAGTVRAEGFGGLLDVCDPTYNRPSSTSSLSGVGTAVFYEYQAFTVNISGAYTLTMTSATFADGDGNASLYQNSFNPASPLTNIIFYNDDSGPDFLPAFISINLTSGVTYILVSTTFENGITGNYTWDLTGVGSFTFGANSITAGCPATNTYTPTPTNTPTNTYTYTPTNTPTHTYTYTPTNTPTHTPTYTPSNTLDPSVTPSPTGTETPTDVPVNTATPSPTASATLTELPSSTPTSAFTPTITPTSTFTPEPICRYPLPPGSVQGRITANIVALYAPDLQMTTNVIIPAGSSWWVIGAQSGFYQLWIACGAMPVWVPAQVVTPNYDDVWRGAPLPDAGGV